MPAGNPLAYFGTEYNPFDAMVSQVTGTTTTPPARRRSVQQPTSGLRIPTPEFPTPLTASTSMSASAENVAPEPIFDPSMPLQPYQPPVDGVIEQPTDPRFPVNQPAEPAGGGRTRSVGTTPTPATNPTTPSGATGDYYTDKANEYSQYPGPWQGQVTRDDVLAYHNYAQQAAAKGTTNLQFADWWNRGKPAQFFDPYDGAQYQPGPGAPLLPDQPGGGQPGGGQTFTPQQTPPQGGGVVGQGGGFNDVLAGLQKQFSPLFDQQMQRLSRELLHHGSLTGAVNSGGYDATSGRALVELAAQQGAQLGGMAFTAQQAELDRVLASEGYDVERYKADKGYAASVNNANASVAAANAAAEASRYRADIDRELGILGADTTREGNMYDFISRLYGLSPDILKFIMGTDPTGILGGFPPGDVVVKP